MSDSDWTNLADLEVGVLFEDEGHKCIALKTEYNTERRAVVGGLRWLEPDCYIVGSGERYCPLGGKHPADVRVRPVSVNVLLNRIAELERATRELERLRQGEYERRLRVESERDKARAEAKRYRVDESTEER